MAKQADIASDVIDRARIEAVARAVGTLRLHELILILSGRVQSIAAAAEIFPAGAEACLTALHQSRGSAASLGFLALADGLARMEALVSQALAQAQAAERDPAAASDAVRQASRALPGLWQDAVQATRALVL